MSSRLDRIEAWAKFALKNGAPEDKFEYVLALVNVAKAAEGLMLSLPDQRASNYPEPGSPYGHLREALAALGKADGQ